MELISLEKRGNFHILSLLSPQNRNALSRKLVSELFQALDSISSVPPKDARALLIKGDKLSFCSGADLKERIHMTQNEVLAFLENLRLLFQKLESLPMPTIALLEASAFGGGLELALACDLRIMETGVQIGLTETKLGIIPGAGGTQRLTRIVGIAKTKELIYTGRKINSEEAFQIGLAQKISNTDQGLTDALSLAEEISASAPLAVRAAKQAIDGGQDKDLKNALIWETQCYQTILETEDRKEALLAFRDKRKPNFQGK